MPDKPGKAVWERLPYADILKPRWQRQLRRDPDSDCLITDLPNRSGTRILLQAIKPDGTAFAGLDRSRKLADALRKLDPAVAGIQLSGFDPASGGRLLEQLIAALLAGCLPDAELQVEAQTRSRAAAARHPRPAGRRSTWPRSGRRRSAITWHAGCPRCRAMN